MKSRWLSAALLAVAVAVSACGGAEEPVEPAPDTGEAREGDVQQQLLSCDEEGNCPAGYHCDPLWVCRRG